MRKLIIQAWERCWQEVNSFRAGTAFAACSRGSHKQGWAGMCRLRALQGTAASSGQGRGFCPGAAAGAWEASSCGSCRPCGCARPLAPVTWANTIPNLRVGSER